MNRSLINANDPFRMGTYAKAHMKKAGCSKEQQKQYVSYVNETTKTNNALREKIAGQQRVSGLKNSEDNSPLIAILPVSNLGSLGGKNYGNIGMTEKKGSLESAYLKDEKKSSHKKSLPPIKDGSSKQEIRIKRTSDI